MHKSECRLCGGSNLVEIKPSNIQSELTADRFKISNYAYGVTLAIERCQDCGLKQCLDVSNVNQFYEALNDPEYEASRDSRIKQERALVKFIQPFSNGKRWLDVGAASGAMIEVANEAGFETVGIEPSEWLAAKAQARGLNVHKGILPHSSIQGKFDVITLVDVIEHVENPFDLMKKASALLADKGVLVVVTPDCDSWVAKFLGWKWWHYRIAHITYFNVNQMDRLAKKCELKRIGFKRPGWRFDLAYIYIRLMSYFSKQRQHAPKLFSSIPIPVNFFDSMLCVYRTVR